MRQMMIRVVVGIVAVACSASADLIDIFTIDTSPLIGDAAGPFSLELQLNDGSGTGDGNNTATLSGFSFGTGSPSGTPFVFGGVTGDMGSSVAMTDTSFFNQFIQGFSPGETMSFQLDLTTNVDSGGVPDEFSVSIVDSSGFEIPTFDPANALIVIDINSSTPSVSTFSTDPSQSPAGGGPPISIPAPTFSPVASSTPEPRTTLLVAMALGFSALLRRKRVDR